MEEAMDQPSKADFTTKVTIAEKGSHEKHGMLYLIKRQICHGSETSLRIDGAIQESARIVPILSAIIANTKGNKRVY